MNLLHHKRSSSVDNKRDKEYYDNIQEEKDRKTR